jgi:MFS transporter, NNP family, nitrate/nitrite transporter
MPRPIRQSPTLALVLSTLAFAACFFAWSLLGPLGPDLQDHLVLSEFQLAVMVAVPVLLGSIMRVPLGIVAERHGGRRVFSALLLSTPLPLVALALWHDSYASMLVLGLLLGFAGASFAVGVPFVNRWYPPQRQGAALGVYGMQREGREPRCSPPCASSARAVVPGRSPCSTSCPSAASWRCSCTFPNCSSASTT